MPLEIRRRPFSGPAQHHIDCAVQEGDIDGAVHTAILLYGDVEKVNDIVRVYDPPREFRTEQLPDGRVGEIVCTNKPPRPCNDVLSEYAYNELLPHIGAERRKGVMLRGLHSEFKRHQDTTECLADWALTDMIQGGCLEGFKKYRRLTRHDKPFKLDLARLESPQYVRRYLHKSKYAWESRARFKRLAQMVAEYGCDEDASIVIDIVDQAAILAEQEHLATSHERILAMAEDPKKEKARRRALKRAALLAVSILGSAAVSDLVQGKAIVLPGEEINLRVKAPSLMSLGHGGVDVSVLDKAGVHIANLCVYIKKTPAIDQVIAMALALQANDVDELLSTANVTNYFNNGAEHPVLKRRDQGRAQLRADQALREQTLGLAGQWAYAPTAATTSTSTLSYVTASTVATGSSMFIPHGHNLLYWTNATTLQNMPMGPMPQNGATGQLSIPERKALQEVQTIVSLYEWGMPLNRAIEVARDYHAIVRSISTAYFDKHHKMWADAFRVFVMGAAQAKKLPDFWRNCTGYYNLRNQT
jgi:hypothetical protein